MSFRPNQPPEIIFAGEFFRKPVQLILFERLELPNDDWRGSGSIKCFPMSVWPMKNICLSAVFAAAVFILTGCTFARYSKLHVRVVDERTHAGISNARIRAFYMKPMLDMTYQRKSHKRTDREGFATLTVATNENQRMILGWTHGIEPMVEVQASGYYPIEVGVPGNAFDGAKPLFILMANSNAPNDTAPELPSIGTASRSDINSVCGRWQATNGESYEFESDGTFENWLQVPPISREAQADGADPSQRRRISSGRYSIEGSLLILVQKHGTIKTNTFLIKEDEPPNDRGKFFESGYSLTLISNNGTKRRYDLMYW